MKKMQFLTAGLIAAMMVPAVAQAQTGELRRDRQEVREQKRDVRQAVRYGNRGDVREQRRDLRAAGQEYREDRRAWKREKRYANWHAPVNFHRFAAGNRWNSRTKNPPQPLN